MWRKLNRFMFSSITKLKNELTNRDCKHSRGQSWPYLLVRSEIVTTWWCRIICRIISLALEIKLVHIFSAAHTRQAPFICRVSKVLSNKSSHELVKITQLEFTCYKIIPFDYLWFENTVWNQRIYCWWTITTWMDY